MKDVLKNFISPVHGKGLCKTDYIPVGDYEGVAWDSPDLIDAQIDIIALRRNLNKLNSSTFILQTDNTVTPNAQALDTLANGFMKNNAGVVETASSIMPADLTITNGRLLTGAKVGETDNVGVEIEKLPYDNLPDLTYKNVIVGDAANRPEAKPTIPFEALPDHVPYGIITYDIFGRPSTSELSSTNYVRGPTVPFSVEGNFAMWSTGTPWLAGGRDIADSGISLASVEGLFTRVSTLETKVTTLEGQVESIEARLDAVEGDIAAIDIDLAELNAQVDLMAIDLAALNLEVDGIAADVALLDATVSGLSAAVAVIQGQIIDIDSRISSLESTVGAHTLAINAINARLASFSITQYGVLVGAASDGINTVAPVVTINNVLISQGVFANPVWSAVTLPSTTTANRLIFSSSNNTLDEIPTANNSVLTTNAGGVPSLNDTLPLIVQNNITRYSTSILMQGADETYSFDSSYQNTTTNLVNAFTPVGASLATNSFNLKGVGNTSFGTKYIRSSTDTTGYGGVDFIFTGTGGITKTPLRMFYTNSLSNYDIVTNGRVNFNGAVVQFSTYSVSDAASFNLLAGSFFTADATSSMTINGAITVPTPTVGAQAANKDYVDTAAAGVLPSSLANQVLITNASNVKSFSSSLPAAVQTNITSLGTVGTGTWNGTIISPTYGGTGVNNGVKTITLGGNLTTSGAFNTTITVTGNTNVTLPTSGTLITNTPKYIVQQAAAELPNAQALGALGTGLVKNTTTTGELSIATAGTDYYSLNNPTRIIDTDLPTGSMYIGQRAGNLTATSTNCTGGGFNSLNALTTGTQNTGWGARTLSAITTNFRNTAIGNSVLQSFTSGNDNTGLGANVFSLMTSGSTNVAVGTSAGTQYATYNQCVIMGSGADTTANNQTNAIAIGYNVTASSNSIVVGNSSITSIKLGNVVLPAATTANYLLYSSSNNTVSELPTTTNNAILRTNGSGVPSFVAGTSSQFWRGDGQFTNVLAGSLGVGGATPITANSIHMSNTVDNRRLVIYENTAGSAHSFYGLGINVNTLRYQVPINASHIFYAATSDSASNELARLTSNKNLIVGGYSTESARLVVYGGVSSAGHESCIRAISPTTTASIEIQSLAVGGRIWELRSGSAGTFDITDRTGVATRLVIDATGRVGIGFGATAGDQLFSVNTANPSKIGAGAWVAYSDGRIKNVTSDYRHGLKELLRVTPKVFKFNDKSGYNKEELEKERVGIIAQDIENLLPECIIERQSAKGIEDLRVVDITPITYALINAVKELYSEISQLKQEIGEK